MIAGGGDLWVLNAGDNSVTELRTSDGAFVRMLSGVSYGISDRVRAGRLGRSPLGDRPGRRTRSSRSTPAPARSCASCPAASTASDRHGPGLRRRSPLDGQSGRQLGHRDQPRHRRVYPRGSRTCPTRPSWPRPAASSGCCAWTASPGAGTAFEVNASSGVVIHRVTGASFTWAARRRLSFVGSKLWISGRQISEANGGTVEEIDTSSDTFVRHLPNTVHRPRAPPWPTTASTCGSAAMG